jgi:hypothetical protein
VKRELENHERGNQHYHTHWPFPQLTINHSSKVIRGITEIRLETWNVAEGVREGLRAVVRLRDEIVIALVSNFENKSTRIESTRLPLTKVDKDLLKWI